MAGEYKPKLRGTGFRVSRSTALRGGAKYSKYRRQNLQKQIKMCMLKLSERKHLTTLVSGGNTTAGAVLSLPLMSQGTSSTTRLGNQIVITDLRWTGSVTATPATAGDIVRVIVLWDKQSDGAAPAVTDVLESASYAAPYNLDKVGSRFSIVFDGHVNLMNSATTLTSDTRWIHGSKKFEKVVYYTGNAGTVADILRNNLCVIFISQTANSSSNVNFQICFRDL